MEWARQIENIKLIGKGGYLRRGESVLLVKLRMEHYQFYSNHLTYNVSNLS